MPTESATVVLLLPEIMLVVLAVCIYLGGAFSQARLAWAGLAVITFVLAGAALYRQDVMLAGPAGTAGLSASLQSGPLLVDALGQNFRWLAVVFGLLFTLIAVQQYRHDGFTELLGSLVLIFAGLMLVAAAGDLILLFLGFELISIPTYVLLFLGGRGNRSIEATAKYFFLSVLSSAMLLYGFAMLYGLGGSTQLRELQGNLLAAEAFHTAGWDLLLPLTLVLIVAGFGFKLAAVPFHFYAPDVYQGTNHLNAGLLAVLPKVAGVLGLVRVVVAVLPLESAWGWKLVVVLALATMTLGNAAALWQTDLRRLMAYSSIAHAGYMLIGLAVAMAGRTAGDVAVDGAAAMLLYVIVYALASLGTFAVLAFLSSVEETNTIRQLGGLGRRHPVMAGCLALFMFSLTGIPPLAGFWGKFTLFKSALDAALNAPVDQTWFIVLAVVASLNAAMAAGYYLRVVGVMYFQAAEGPGKSHERLLAARPLSAGPGLAALGAAMLILVFAFPGSLMTGSQRAAQTAVGPWRAERPLTQQDDADGKVLAASRMSRASDASTPQQ